MKEKKTTYWVQIHQKWNGWSHKKQAKFEQAGHAKSKYFPSAIRRDHWRLSIDQEGHSLSQLGIYDADAQCLYSAPLLHLFHTRQLRDRCKPALRQGPFRTNLHLTQQSFRPTFLFVQVPVLDPHALCLLPFI